MSDDVALTSLDDLGLLSAERGTLEPPIRSVLFGRARFEQHGRSLARTHEVLPAGHAGVGFFPRLDDNVAMLRRACAFIERQAREGHSLGPVAHWLLDNAALLGEQSLAIRQGLPRGFFRLLPRLRDEPLAGLPRVYGVAWAWVAHTDSGFDAALIEAYLKAYGEERELALAELWALPTTLRVVLVENLRRLAERAATGQAAREAAHHWFDMADGQRQIDALTPLLERTRARGVADAFLLTLEQRRDELPVDQREALDAWLPAHLSDIASALTRQQSEATEDQQSVSNAITTLRQLERADWRQIFSRVSRVMTLLQRSPVYAAEREDTQDDSLHAVESLARESARAEVDVARALVALTSGARDDEPQAAPAYWWRGPGEAELRSRLGLAPRLWPRLGTAAFRRSATAAYLIGVSALTVGAVAWLLHYHAGSGAGAVTPGLRVLTVLLLLAPVSEAVVAMVNRLISESVRAVRLPRLALADGIPASQRVLVVIPCLLNSAATISELAARLEQHHLANREAMAQFALLGDWVDADEPHRDTDSALLLAARSAIETLNRRHGAAAGAPVRFLLLLRERQWSPSEGRFIGWERKRGKLEQLVRALVEPAYHPFIDLGALSAPEPGTRYVVTLDADTGMPPGRLRDLVGVAAHPLNLPRLDAEHRRVVSGHGILQPRLTTPLPAPHTVTPYHRLFGGQPGIDPYSAASSELYQDVFGEGSFTGKGLLDVHAVHAVLLGRLPDGQVLSHDLLEGAIAGCAGVNDITFVEAAPSHPDVAASRLHRWTRGDWQLLPFLLQFRRLPMPLISRWKMLDNLRRSLVTPLSLLLLMQVLAFGGLTLPWALGTVAAAFGAGPLLGAIAGLAPSRDTIALRRFYRLSGADLLRALCIPLWQVAQLVQLAMLHLDAIVRALWRQRVSRRHLLQWTTAAAAEAAARRGLHALWRSHRSVTIAAGVLAVALAAAAFDGAAVQWPAAVLLLLVWAASPLWTWWAARPVQRRAAPLAERDQDYLYALARDTWRYYERHVGAEDHHLPPDNVQLLPHTMVAHRTSPTNIGLYLMACACARELGFIGRLEMAERIGATLDTLAALPRHRGHFFNWYDTRALAVLAPGYVSTVDSGNCSAHMLGVAAACEAAASELHPQAAPQRALQQAQQRLRALQPVLAGASDLRTLGELASGAWHWPANFAEAQLLQRRVQRAQSELDALNLGHVADDDGSMRLLQDHLATLSSALADVLAEPGALAPRLAALAQRLRAIALAPDYAMLYDSTRHLMAIGLRVDSGHLDENHYDLLASEARLTSLVAIAKGDVPVRHWSALGRPFFAEGVEVGLKSWSGSMFEYLMPSLVLGEPVGSVLYQVARSAVAEQQREGREHGTPWGISESAIAGQDHTLAYQYGPQGVARLALRRTPTDERVVAPYATAMALTVAPAAATDNLRALQALGARGAFGFIEALDYSPQRQSTGGPFVAVRTFMAHHQAMSLLALTHVLADRAPQRWTAADPNLRAVTSLLHERAPREVPVLHDPPVVATPRRLRAGTRVLEINALDGSLPATHLLSNGRHAVALRSHGGGFSQWDGVRLNRWRDDVLRDAYGSFFYLQRAGQPARHSLSAHPAPDPEASYRCRMQADRVCFDAVWPDLQARTTVWVSPEDDCELRQLELTNTSGATLELVLSSAFEVTLADARADEAHPAFSNLFIQARWDAGERALYLRRRPRLPDEHALQAVHCLAGVEGTLKAVQVCTDRARWLGRYGTPAAPLGDGGAAPLAPTNSAQIVEDPLPGVAMDTGLDPVAVISAQLTLAPGASTRLTFCTAASRDAELLGTLVDKYRQASHAERASSMSHTMAGIRLRELQFDADTWTAMLHLQTLLTSHVTRDAPADVRGGDGGPRCDRRLLWRHGVSGDRPIVLVTINGENGLGLVQTLKKGLRHWSAAGLGVDLVVCNAEPDSYQSPVQNQVQMLHDRLQSQVADLQPAARRGALVLLRERELGVDERHTLQMLARVRLQADGRPLGQHVERLLDDHRDAYQRRAATPSRAVLPPFVTARRAAAVPAPENRFADGGDFSFAVSPERFPARPWVNVLANPEFGCQVSEVGGGYTWAGNSRMQQLTPWSNDPLADPAGEWLLLQDLDRGRVWALGRRLLEGAPRDVVHGQGYTRMRQLFDDLEVTLTWCVDAEAALKQVQVSVRCEGARAHRLRLVAMAEWMLGSTRQERLSLLTRAERVATGDAVADADGAASASGVLALQATQLDHLGGFGRGTAFIAWRPARAGDSARADAAQPAADDWTCDRREFFDPAGRLVLPERLGRQSGAGLDACAALACRLDPAAGRSVGATLLLGYAADAAAAGRLLAEAWPVDPAQRLARQRAPWAALTDAVQVQTPDARFDALVNHWLPYQTLACRLWARAGFYQAGGAFGFRDQLQDAMSLVSHAPDLLAQQIRANAARQFIEGDVQHWWHAPGGAGVRTHFSDDRLWLPLALAHYEERTGDEALADEFVNFLAGGQIPDGAEDLYETPAVSEQRATIYEHAARAIDRSLRSGAHGLPLFGSGDWNDGMNRVGSGGRGESVWLAWFLCSVVDSFLPLAVARDDMPRISMWRAARRGWAAALESAGWDGDWYRRGFFDDGSPLGSAHNAECRIDLIAQAWAVLSAAGDPARARQAMASAQRLLVNTDANLVALLDPPLQHALPDAGYIQAYPPGVRENGGQYNHAAVWALMAAARLGDGAGVWQMFTALSPAHRWLDGERGAAYALEPYVLAGDVYTQSPWVGRGGWSWYTGSAGWLLRAAIESMCGVVLARGRVTLAPCLPPHWPQASVTLSHDGRRHRFVVCSSEAVARAARQREPAARSLAPGEPVDLAACADGSVHVLAVAARTPAPAAAPARLAL